MMAKLTILSWNLRGLNTDLKIASSLDIISRKGADIAMFQETHVVEKDICKVKDNNYRVVASSSANNKAKGVIILMRNSLKFHIVDKGNDQDGRIAYLKGNFAGEKIAFITCYAPNSYEPAFFCFLSKIITKMTGYQIILGGDMNAVLDPLLDRSTCTQSTSSANSALKKLISNFSLVDIWRLQHHTRREYTFFSARHQTFSRIDYILISSGMVPFVQKAEIQYMSMSDHHANLCRFVFPNVSIRASRWRFNLTLLQNKEYSDQFKAGFFEFMLINKNSVKDIRFLWSAVKGYIRNKSIAFSSDLNKTQLKAISELETIQSALIKQQQNYFDTDRQKILHTIESELNMLNLKRGEFLVHRARQSSYIDGSSPSFLLASKIRTNERLADIPFIMSNEGVLLNDPLSINLEFQHFYKTLYTSELDRPTSTKELDSFFVGLNLPKLTANDMNFLDSPITLQELYDTLKLMKQGKSPGWDGLPPEFYLQFWADLGPILLEMIHTAIDQGGFHRDVNTAIISLLHKKGKDPSLCSSYRPISLINTDTKLYAKVLTRRLESVLPTLVHPDQTGFVKHRLSSDNIRRLFHIIHVASNLQSPCAVMSVDAEKAFDRLEWPYLWYTMNNMGFSDTFMNMLKILYYNPTAMVLTGNQCSPQFPIARGTRQGCPASALLFAISLEPLAQKIRLSEAVKPIRISNTYHKISLYADDLLIYMDQVPTTLPAVLDLFTKFSAISGYKINLTKSLLLPLNAAMIDLDTNTEIPVVQNFRYLGIDIHPSLDRTITRNYRSMYNSIKANIDKWTNLTLSLAERISIVKMNILPRVNFLANMLPMPPPLGFWDKLQSRVSKYIWKGQFPRIRTTILQHDRMSGGLNVPNFELYYYAFMLRPLKNWFNDNSKVPWVEIEKQIVSPFLLKDVLFSALSDRYCLEHFGPIVAHSIYIWNYVEKLGDWGSNWHLDTPIFRNNHLIIGGKSIYFPQWQKQGIYTLPDIMNDDGLRSFQDLKSDFNLPGSSFFFYLQLRMAMRTYGVPWNQPLKMHPMVEMIKTPHPGVGFVSYVYKKMQHSTQSYMGIVQVWNTDLKNYGLTIDWKRVWRNISDTSRNYNNQLLHYKMIHRFYLSPRKCCQLQITSSPFCLLCSQRSMGTYIHMFWECSGVRSFWVQIAQVLSDIIGSKIPCLPNVMLLNDDSSLNILGKKNILFAGLTAAKKILVMRWKPPHVLFLDQWMSLFHSILILETSIARANGAKRETIEALTAAAELVKCCI